MNQVSCAYFDSTSGLPTNNDPCVVSYTNHAATVVIFSSFAFIIHMLGFSRIFVFAFQFFANSCYPIAYLRRVLKVNNSAAGNEGSQGVGKTFVFTFFLFVIYRIV